MRPRQRTVARIALAYSGFVLYGSLMPWAWRWRPLCDAMAGYLGLTDRLALVFSLRDLAANAVLYILMGLAWGAAARPAPSAAQRWLHAAAVFLACSLFSAAIEFAQLYVPQRTSSLYDWLANTGGAALGAALWDWYGARRLPVLPSLAGAPPLPLPSATTPGMRRAVALAALPYILVLAAANHWLASPWLGWQDAVARLADIHWLPFYYHQEASTMVALASVLWQLLLYAPLGLARRWLWRPAAAGQAASSVGAVALAAAVATVMEAGRLFVPGQHPDLGNVLVAALSALIGFTVLPGLRGLVRRRATVRRGVAQAPLPTPQVMPRPVPSRTSGRAPSLAARSLSLGLLAICLYLLIRFPVWQLPLAAALLVYAMALVRWPMAWLWVLPAALPVVDLAPLSGWFFVDEFDLAVLVTIAVLLWRRQALMPHTREDRRSRCLWLAFTVSVVVSAVLGLLPLQVPDANAVASYHSHYNALRIAKGFAWALALLALLGRAGPDRAGAGRRLGAGIVIGLAGATALALWERFIYPGLFDFAGGHRIGAFFSSMHNGGSHIEAYLVLAAPFLLVASSQARCAWLRVAGAALFVAATYVLAVTFARGGYAAFALAVLLTIGLLGRCARHGRQWRVPATMLAGLALAGAAGFAVIGGSFAQQRLASTGADLDTRFAHWREALSIMDPGPATALFGMGLGRFPQTYHFRNRDNDAPATFRYHVEPVASHLTLGSGSTVYVEQFVDVRPQRRYRLSLDTRSAGGPARLNLLLCERTYFASYGCESATIDLPASGAGWRHAEAQIESRSLGGGPWWRRRPVKLSLENASRGTIIDLRQLTLREEGGGANLVDNGDFARGNDRWFFSSNFNHLHWHIKNLWVGLYFDQGWFGVVTLALLLAHGLANLARKAWQGRPYAVAAFAATMGFLCVGLFDSLFDAPRLTTLFFLVLGVGSGFAPRSDVDGAAALGKGPADGATAPLALSTPSAAPAAPLQRTAQLGGLRPWTAAALPAGLTVLVLALLIAVLTRLPGLPYNLRALLNPFHPVAAPLALGVFIFWGLGAPAWGARRLETSRSAWLLWPALLLLYAVVAWAVVRQAVLPIMIHKVAGSPVLGWSWEWETLLRFSALQAVFGLLLTGGCLAVRATANGASARALLVWLLWTAALVPLLHLAVVEFAATDNLTELMAGGGSLQASAMLSLWCLLIGVAAAMLSGGAGGLARRPLPRAGAALLSIPLGWALLQFGLESHVQKYGVSFSGLQFLLSADRQHYATGLNLGLRYALFHLAVTGLVALAQWPWRAIPSEALQRPQAVPNWTT